MKNLAFDLDLKFAEGSNVGEIDGYGSVFGVVDRGGDIVAPGAFKASLAEWKARGSLPAMLWHHNQAEPIGVWTSAEEDERGLRLKGQLVMDVPAAAAARALIAAGAVKGLSIGYRAVAADVDRKTGIRTLKQVQLWEISLVTTPMLPEAQIDTVKALDPRALEAELRRNCGLSNAGAVKAVAIFKQHLRDAGENAGTDRREGETDLILSLRKAANGLRG